MPCPDFIFAASEFVSVVRFSGILQRHMIAQETQFRDNVYSNSNSVDITTQTASGS
jgi:hypothetical protein